MGGRVVLHSDLNNCYASIECMLHPELRGKYIAVCGSTEDRHGIVLAKNQLAKQCGVKTGEVIWEAKQKCPQLTIVPPHMDQYLKFSRIVRAIYLRYSPEVESFGIDESWIELTGSPLLAHKTPAEIANEIRKAVKEEVGLTVSIGVSFNKIFAKLGSDMKKPDAVTEITEASFKEQIWPLDEPPQKGCGATGSTPSEIWPKQIVRCLSDCSESTARNCGSSPMDLISPA